MSSAIPPEITPDEKDWATVAAAGCAECGHLPQAPQLTGALLLASVDLWRARIEATDARLRPDASTWSPLEYLAHVRDLTLVFAQRLSSTLAENEPELASWDQDAAAVEASYYALDPAEVIEEYAIAATALAEAFDAVVGSQWERKARRSDAVTFTVASMANYFLHDIRHHLHDVGVKLPDSSRLGDSTGSGKDSVDQLHQRHSDSATDQSHGHL